MSRDVYTQTFGSYEVRTNGALTGTYSTPKFFSDLRRADSTNGEVDGDWIHPTDYWASRVSEIHPEGEWKVTQFKKQMLYKGTLTALTSGSYVPVGYSIPSFDPKLLNEAIIKAREDLLGDDAFNFAQNYAERQQAIDLVANRLTSILRGYRYARKRKWKQAFRAIGIHKNKIARRMSENVLAWNYGVAPLADDIGAAIRRISDPTPANFLKVKGVAKSGNLGKPKRVVDDQVAMPRNIDYAEEKFAVCVMWVKPENANLIHQAATGINNPFLLGYELTPYSFIVDWAWDIGGWLTALGATAGWSFYSGYTMERTECMSVYLSYFGGGSKGTCYIFNDSFRHCKQFRRKRLTSFPIPGLPGFKNPLSLVHALNAVSLFGVRT